MEIIISVIFSLITCCIFISAHLKILENKFDVFLDKQNKDFKKNLEEVEEIVLEVLEKRKDL